MKADLHTHTTASDGSMAPNDLVRLAAEEGVEMLSITDHDSVAAYEQLDPGAATGLQLVPGIEFSASWHGAGIHVVGLAIDPVAAVIRDATRQQREARITRAREIADRLAKRLRIESPFEAVMEASGGCPGRPDFARYLVDTGAVSDVKTAFRKHLGTGKIGDVKAHWRPVDDIVRWITDAGGVAVLAHPAKYRFTRSKLVRLCRDFRSAGGRAMEVSCGQQDPSRTRSLADICEDFGMLASCGSDFHHPGQAWSRPGRYAPMPRRVTPVWSAWTTG